jgi:PleD family two-component response regulator
VEDLRGHLGNDAFAMAFPGESKETIDEAMQKLLAEFTGIKFLSKDTKKETFAATFSMGLAEYPSDAQDVEGLLNTVNQKLWKVKQEKASVTASGPI